MPNTNGEGGNSRRAKQLILRRADAQGGMCVRKLGIALRFGRFILLWADIPPFSRLTPLVA